MAGNGQVGLLFPYLQHRSLWQHQLVQRRVLLQFYARAGATHHDAVHIRLLAHRDSLPHKEVSLVLFDVPGVAFDVADHDLAVGPAAHVSRQHIVEGDHVLGAVLVRHYYCLPAVEVPCFVGGWIVHIPVLPVNVLHHVGFLFEGADFRFGAGIFRLPPAPVVEIDIIRAAHGASVLKHERALLDAVALVASGHHLLGIAGRAFKSGMYPQAFAQAARQFFNTGMGRKNGQRKDRSAKYNALDFHRKNGLRWGGRFFRCNYFA
jgi:hypothetical protein